MQVGTFLHGCILFQADSESRLEVTKHQKLECPSPESPQEQGPQVHGVGIEELEALVVEEPEAHGFEEL